MDKQLFIETIGVIEKQEKLDSENADLFAQIFPNAWSANLLYNTSSTIGQLIRILEIEMNDKDGWVSYFCYELDFGKDYKDGSVTEKDKSIIDLSTASKLFDFLIKENEGCNNKENEGCNNKENEGCNNKEN